MLGYLADRGVPEDQLDRVKVPAGLDLGRTSHREIAVAILAELVQLRASGELGGGRAGAPAGRGRHRGPTPVMQNELRPEPGTGARPRPSTRSAG